MTLPSHKASSGAASDLMFYVAAEGKPSNYSKSFEFLVDWVDNSLDMYKASLLQKFPSSAELASSVLTSYCLSFTNSTLAGCSQVFPYAKDLL